MTSFKHEVYRKLIHLSSLWMVGAVYILTQVQSITLFAVLFIGMIGFEYGRHYIKVIQNLTSKYMSPILRNHENHSMTGAFYVILAILLSVLLLPKEHHSTERQ